MCCRNTTRPEIMLTAGLFPRLRRWLARHNARCASTCLVCCFTGIPNQAAGPNTRAVFGDYISLRDPARGAEPCHGADLPRESDRRQALDEAERGGWFGGVGVSGTHLSGAGRRPVCAPAPGGGGVQRSLSTTNDDRVARHPRSSKTCVRRRPRSSKACVRRTWALAFVWRLSSLAF